MRSLLLTFDYPPTVGGIAHVLGLFWRLAGHDGCLIFAPSAPGARDFDRQHPVATVRFPVLSTLGSLGKAVSVCIAALWSLVWVARHRPQLLVAGQLVRAGPLAYAWHRLTGRPFDVWVYGGETSASFVSPALLNRHLHKILRRARTVFTNSPYTTREMLDFGLGREAVVEVPLGVDRGTFHPAPADSAYIQRYDLSGKLVITTVGRLIERKGVDSMLTALAELRAQLPPWHYLIVSDGPYRPSVS